MYMGASYRGPSVPSFGRRFGTGSRGSGLTSGTTTGVSGKLIGPFPASQGCPAGSVKAHEFGQGLKRKVQCRVVEKAAPSYAPPPPQPQQPIIPNITISPTFQQDFDAQVSPTISPIIDSPYARGGTATPIAVDAGGQTASGGGTQSPQSSGVSAEMLRQQQEMQREQIEAERQRAREQRAMDQAAFDRQMQQHKEFEAREREMRDRELQLKSQMDQQLRAMEAQMRQAETAQQQAEYQRLIDEQTAQFNAELERVAAEGEAAAQAAQQAAQAVPVFQPGAAVIQAPAPTPQPSTPVQTDDEPPWLIIGGVAIALAGGAYLMTQRKGKRRKR